MSFFKPIDQTDVEMADDRVGGGYEPLPSDIYHGTIKQAYITKSKGGATAVNLIVECNGQEVRTQEWVFNKKGENFFVDSNTKKKKMLPSYQLMNDIAIMVLNDEKGLAALDDPEDRYVKLYDFEQRKEVNKEVPVLVQLIGGELLFAVKRVIEDKTKDNGSGVYVPTGETRTVNAIEKVLHPEHKVTVQEAMNGITPVFYDQWLEKHKGNDRDATAAKKGAQASTGGQQGQGRPDTGGQSSGGQKTSLFG